MKGSPNFKPAAWARVQARLRRDLPGLSAEDTERVLRAVGADLPRTLGRLDRYLCAHETGLLKPRFDCPAVVVRLTVQLAAAGYAGVTPLGCSRCGQQAELTQRPGERICASCAIQERGLICAHCGGAITNRVARRLPEGHICSSCYAKHPLARRRCGNCGRMRRPTRRLPDGGVLCQGCAPRPQHTCARCGRTRPAQCMTDEGPICNSCYAAVKLSWVCGLCGAVRRRQHGSRLGPHLCRACRSALHHPARAACARCGRIRAVTAKWPAGTICSSCFHRSRQYPQPFAACGDVRVLVGTNEDLEWICGPCAGWHVEYRCRDCGQPGIKSKRLCSRCITRSELRGLLAGPDGQIPNQLQPLADALLSARDPRSVAVWLGKSSAATMLSELARSEQPITHDALDRLSPSRHADYIREILVRTAILEPRNEYLERLVPWVDHYLTDVPDHHARLLRAYAHWYLLHRARRRKGLLPRSGADRIRTRVRVAHEFLAWIQSQGHTVATVGQDLVDNWLANGTAWHHEIRPFLHWANQRGLSTGVSAPATKPAQPTVFLDEQTQLHQLHRCLTDDSIRIDLRAGAALMLLYGLNLTRILAITRSQIQHRSGETYLSLADHDLLMPPILAELLAQLPHRRRRSTLPEPDTSSRLLFPGRTPTRPVDAGIFANRLKRHGINIRGGRNTALIRLASELPAAVLADLLGVDIATATRWAKYAKRDWHTYIAERRTGPESSNSTTLT